MIKLCMIGARGHGSMVLRGLKDNDAVQLAGVSSGCKDDFGRLLDRCRETVGHVADLPVFEDWRCMLDTVKPDIVCVDGPFELHAEMCAEAFRRDIHVLVEKPAALTLDDLRIMEDAHRGSRSHCAALMALRYSAPFHAAWRIVQSGKIGLVRLLNAQKSYVLGRRSEFFHRRATSGGMIPWVGSHAIDLVYWCSGAEFENVAAFHARAHNRGHGDLESTAVCNFRMTNDIMATVTLDYLRPATAGSHGDDRVRVVGAEGYVEVRGGRVWVADSEHEGVYEAPAPELEFSLFNDFVAHVDQPERALIGARDVFRVTEACLLARQAADDVKMLAFPRD